jgi:hypothetical protein
MASFYPGLLGGDPVEVDDMSGYRDGWLRDQDGSPFASAYTPSGLLKYGQPSQYVYDWSRLAPGAPVVPYVDTTTQGLLATPSDRYPQSRPGDYYSDDDETVFDPLGVEGYMATKSPWWGVAQALMPSPMGLFMGAAAQEAERQAVERNRAQYGFEPLSLIDGYGRKYQTGIERAPAPPDSLRGKFDTAISGPLGQLVADAKQELRDVFGVQRSDVDKSTIGHPDYEVPDWLEVVDRPEAVDFEEGGAYTQLPDTALYNEADLQEIYGRHDEELGHLVGGMPELIGDLGLDVDISENPNNWTGYDPSRRAHGIYAANYARDAKVAYETGGRHPFEAPETWTDSATGLTRTNATQADRDAYREMVDEQRWADAVADDRTTGSGNRVTEGGMVDKFDQWGNLIGRMFSTEPAWNVNLTNPYTDVPGYTLNLDWEDPDYDQKTETNEAIEREFDKEAEERGLTTHAYRDVLAASPGDREAERQRLRQLAVLNPTRRNIAPVPLDYHKWKRDWTKPIGPGNRPPGSPDWSPEELDAIGAWATEDRDKGLDWDPTGPPDDPGAPGEGGDPGGGDFGFGGDDSPW